MCPCWSNALSPQFGLNEETAKAAKPGKMAAIMDERSGMPPESERAPLPERQKAMKKRGKGDPGGVSGAGRWHNAVAAASADNLAKMINEAGLCKAVPAKQSVLLKASQADPNEMKVLWDLAREFRDYVKKNPTDADYVLYADYRLHPAKLGAGIRAFRCVRPPGRVGHRGYAELASPRLPEHQADIEGRLRQTSGQTPGGLPA